MAGAGLRRRQSIRHLLLCHPRSVVRRSMCRCSKEDLARFRRTTSRAQPAAGGGAAQNAMIELLVITDSVIIYILVIGDSVPFPYIHDQRSLNRTWLPMH